MICGVLIDRSLMPDVVCVCVVEIIMKQLLHGKMSCDAVVSSIKAL